MQLDPRRPRPAGRRRSRAAAAGVVLGLLCAVPARADRASGTWTGSVEARGNYYWEESTRVVAPAVELDLESPGGVRMGGHYLVDSITSASQAAGTQVDIAFTEVRHDFSLWGGYELDLGEAHLDLGLSTRFSFEPDYRSTGAGVNAALSLNQRTTVLRASVFYIHDDIRQKLRGVSSGTSPDGRALSDRGEVGELDGVATTLIWDQVLSPVLTAQVGYDFVYNTGFLQNPYRMVSVAGALRPETHPGTRFRHAVSGRLAWYFRPSRTALHALYRSYLDSWDIGAVNPEVRVYQAVGAFAQLRLRYRYYKQTRAFFYEDDSSNYTSTDELFTVDPKMSAFHSHLQGVQLLIELEFLEQSKLDFLRHATFDLNFDYIWNTNRYGNGVIAEVGLRVPF